MQGFEMSGFLPASSSLTGAAGFGGSNTPQPPMSLQQSFAMQASELPPFLRDFDSLYPTLNLADAEGHPGLPPVPSLMPAAPVPVPPRGKGKAAAAAAAAPAGDGQAGLQEDKGELERARRTYKSCTGKLEGLEWEIKNFIPPLSPAQLKQFQAAIADLAGELESLKREAHGLLSRILLVPSQFEQWKTLAQQLEVHMTQLEVYKTEVAAVAANKVESLCNACVYTFVLSFLFSIPRTALERWW
jgi:hypothetical protein